jgi:predicted O-methyltransferase YrrM
VNLADQYVQRRDTPSDIVDHLPFLYDQACRFPGVTVLELGTRGGNSTAAFLAAADVADGHVWSVDVSPPRTPDWWNELERWSFLQGDDLSHEATAFAPPVVDVLFIDTSHHYTQTLAELELYVPSVRPCGVVLLHDTELAEPEGSPRDQTPFPVAAALDEFCERHDMKWTNRPGCNGLGVIEV